MKKKKNKTHVSINKMGVGSKNQQRLQRNRYSLNFGREETTHVNDVNNGDDDDDKDDDENTTIATTIATTKPGPTENPKAKAA